jgi:hypothetical protein
MVSAARSLVGDGQVVPGGHAAEGPGLGGHGCQLSRLGPDSRAAAYLSGTEC